jgi:hypothetical protein
VTLPESLKFKVALRVPVAVGPKTRFTVQVAEAASVEPQVLLKTAKSPGFAPESVMLLIVIGVAFPLVNVITFCPPLFPMATDAQLWLVGETVTAARQLTPESAQAANAARIRKRNALGIDARRNAKESLPIG